MKQHKASSFELEVSFSEEVEDKYCFHEAWTCTLTIVS